MGGGGLLVLLGMLALGLLLIFSFLPKANAGTGPAMTFVPTPSATGGVPNAGQTTAGNNDGATATALFQSNQDALFTATAIQAITDTNVAGLNAAADTATSAAATADGATAATATASAGTAMAQATVEAATSIVVTQTANANATATQFAGIQATDAIISTYVAAHETATAVAQATAHAQQTLQAKAALMAQFTYNWVSTNPNGGMTRLIISKVNANTVSFHGYGSCTPTDCDWGTINVSFTPPVLTGTWSFSFKTTQIKVQLSGSSLSATTVDTYNDGRATQTHSYTMTH